MLPAAEFARSPGDGRRRRPRSDDGQFASAFTSLYIHSPFCRRARCPAAHSTSAPHLPSVRLRTPRFFICTRSSASPHRSCRTPASPARRRQTRKAFIFKRLCSSFPFLVSLLRGTQRLYIYIYIHTAWAASYALYVLALSPYIYLFAREQRKEEDANRRGS